MRPSARNLLPNSPRRGPGSRRLVSQWLAEADGPIFEMRLVPEDSHDSSALTTVHLGEKISPRHMTTG